MSEEQRLTCSVIKMIYDNVSGPRSPRTSVSNGWVGTKYWGSGSITAIIHQEHTVPITIEEFSQTIMRVKWFLNFQSLSHPFKMSWCSGTSKIFPSWDLYKITFFRNTVLTESMICSALKSAALSGFIFRLTWLPPASVFVPTIRCVKPNAFGAREDVEWLCYYIQTEIVTKTKHLNQTQRVPSMLHNQKCTLIFSSFFWKGQSAGTWVAGTCNQYGCSKYQSFTWHRFYGATFSSFWVITLVILTVSCNSCLHTCCSVAFIHKLLSSVLLYASVG